MARWKHYCNAPVSLYWGLKPSALMRHVPYYLVTGKGPASEIGH